jgi:hypothetical protein
MTRILRMTANFSNLEFGIWNLELWNFGTLEPWNPGTYLFLALG